MRPIGNIIKDVVGYPFRGSGRSLFVVCALLGVLERVAGLAPVLGLGASVLLNGYLCGVYFQLIQSSATGSQEAPMFPDLSNLIDDILMPFFKVMGVIIVSFLPLIVWAVFLLKEKEEVGTAYVLCAWALVYFPMAMLAVVVLGRLGASSPHIVLPAIFRAGGLYWVGVAMFFVFAAGKIIVRSAVDGKILVGTALMSALEAYMMMAHARILGLIYREKEEELDWG